MLDRNNNFKDHRYRPLIHNYVTAWYYISSKSLKRNPNGQFAVFGNGKYHICTDLAWEIKFSGSALQIVWSPAGEYAARETASRIKICRKDFQVCNFIYSSYPSAKYSFVRRQTLISSLGLMYICYIDFKIKIICMT